MLNFIFPLCVISRLFSQSHHCLSSHLQFLLVFQLLKEINRTSISRALRIRRQAALSDPRTYVSANFKTLPLEFTLGDGRNYGDFHNRPLLNGQEYVFFVLALLDLSENVSFKHSLRWIRWKDPFPHVSVNIQPFLPYRPCTPPALILSPWPHLLWIPSQLWMRKRAFFGWLGQCWPWSSSSASSLPFSSLRGKKRKGTKNWSKSIGLGIIA